MEISIWNINFSMCYVMNMLRIIFVFIWCVLVTWRWKKLTLKSFPPPFILFVCSFSNSKHWTESIGIGAHLVTEEVTPVGSVKFDRLIELTVWPGCSVAFSKVKRSVTLEDSLGSFHIWIVLQLEINTACAPLYQLIRGFQFCWNLWLSRRKHSWWSPNWLWVWIIESWFTCLGSWE